MGAQYANPQAVTWISLFREGEKRLHIDYAHKSLQGQILEWEQQFSLRDGDTIKYGIVSCFGSTFELVRAFGGHWTTASRVRYLRDLHANPSDLAFADLFEFAPPKRQWLLEVGKRGTSYNLYHLPTGCRLMVDPDYSGTPENRRVAHIVLNQYKEGEHPVSVAKVRVLLKVVPFGVDLPTCPADIHFWADVLWAKAILAGTYVKAELPNGPENKWVHPYWLQASEDVEGIVAQ